MRLPFNIGEHKLEDDARVKFSYTSPELHQNIEISLDGDDTTVEALLDAFQRFLGALGICLPPNIFIGFVEMEEENGEQDDEDGDEKSNK